MHHVAYLPAALRTDQCGAKEVFLTKIYFDVQLIYNTTNYKKLQRICILGARQKMQICFFASLHVIRARVHVDSSSTVRENHNRNPFFSRSVLCGGGCLWIFLSTSKDTITRFICHHCLKLGAPTYEFADLITSGPPPFSCQLITIERHSTEIDGDSSMRWMRSRVWSGLCLILWKITVNLTNFLRFFWRHITLQSLPFIKIYGILFFWYW
jgi:hypothetical protein